MDPSPKLDHVLVDIAKVHRSWSCRRSHHRSSAAPTISNANPLAFGVLFKTSPQRPLSSYVDDSPQEFALLRRVAEDLPWQTYAIALVELAEQISIYSCTRVFTNFIQQPLPAGSSTGAGGANGQSGALGLGQRASTALTTFSTFWPYVTTFAGAYLADTYWGRFKTILVQISVATIGYIPLIVSGLPGVIERTHTALAVFALAIIVLGIGVGGIKTNMITLVMEQACETKPVIKKKQGVRVIVDPALTAAKLSAYLYLLVNIGAVVGIVATTYAEKYVGYWLSFSFSAVVLLSTPILLVVCQKRCVHYPPQRGVLSSTLRVWRAASAGRWSLNPITTWSRMREDGFWDAAKPSMYHGRVGGEVMRPDWMTWDDQWVDELRRCFKAGKVFLWYLLYWLTYIQLTNNLISQAAAMNMEGISGDMVVNVEPLVIIVMIPFCDLLLYPGLARLGIRFTPIKRITAGFIAGAASMAWAAVVQHYIYKRSPCGHFASSCTNGNGEHLASDLSVWVQSGSYILIAISEIFVAMTGLEYAFTKAPKNMRSLVMSFFLFLVAISEAASEAFIFLSQDPLLVWNYGSMSILTGVSGVLFWFMYRNLDAEEDDLNRLDAGRVDVNADCASINDKYTTTIPRRLGGRLTRS